MKTEDERLPLLAHLGELRRRLLFVISAALLSMVAALGGAPWILRWLQAPIAARLAEGQLRFVVLSPLEQPLTYLKVAFFTGLAVSMPVLLYNVWAFTAPGLLPRERRFLFPLVLLGSLFFVGGVLFCYYLVVPFGLGQLLALLPAEVEATLSVDKYFSLVVRLLLGFGLIFQTPLVVALLVRSRLVPLAVLRKGRKYIFVLAFILGAFLTPMDPWTQIAMAVPLLFFFELGMILGRLWTPREPD